MTLVIRCQCGKVFRQEVRPGYNARALLERHGWSMAPGRYYCPDCINPHEMTLRDYTGIID
jgi:hypothetical protein